MTVTEKDILGLRLAQGGFVYRGMMRLFQSRAKEEQGLSSNTHQNIQSLQDIHTGNAWIRTYFQSNLSKFRSH